MCQYFTVDNRFSVCFLSCLFETKKKCLLFVCLFVFPSQIPWSFFLLNQELLHHSFKMWLLLGAVMEDLRLEMIKKEFSQPWISWLDTGGTKEWMKTLFNNNNVLFWRLSSPRITQGSFTRIIFLTLSNDTTTTSNNNN